MSKDKGTTDLTGLTGDLVNQNSRADLDARLSDSRKDPSGLKPKLRFPEFLDEGDWNKEYLNQIAQPVFDTPTNKDEVLTLSGEQGVVLQSEYFGKKIAGNNVERYIRVSRNDFIYNDRTTKLSTYGSIKRLSKYESGLVSPIYKCFRFNGDENYVFWEWYFESGIHETQLHGLVNEGARAGRFNISIDKFLSTLVFSPSKPEQQKIADCLTSLDELIAAERAQLETLKAYKKGLLQNLFPAEGEQAPKLRFPEFQSAGEWEETELGSLIDLQSGYAFQSEYFSDKGKKLLTPKNFTQNGHASFNKENTKYTTEETDLKYLCKEGDLLLLLTDLTPTCELLGKPLLLTKDDSEVLLNQRIVKVISKGSLEIKFLLYFFLTDSYRQRIKNTATGSTVRHSSTKIIASTKIYFPLDKKEQEKIAEALTSIDEAIAGQSQRVAGLAVHKQGLLQGLFP